MLSSLLSIRFSLHFVVPKWRHNCLVWQRRTPTDLFLEWSLQLDNGRMCEVFYAGHRRVKVIILTFPSNNVNKISLGWIRENTWLFKANKKAEPGPAFRFMV